jgi:hypothetical protein
MKEPPTEGQPQINAEERRYKRGLLFNFGRRLQVGRFAFANEGKGISVRQRLSAAKGSST